MFSLYRKYRPHNFQDIVGQDNTITALSNAVIKQKLTHSYLFYGPRGTGKTTTARILANLSNCLNAKKNQVCDNCSNCLLAKNNSILDIVEIDAASNNGIDSIREINERIKNLPIKGKYRFYIIDEVHMLSISAFNALLKTLEEPPSHIIFILATTEYYKVPNTVRSRCQQYEFKLISERLISERLIKVLNSEKINFDSDALDSICHLSEGSLRDALTILEKIIIFSNRTKITLKKVNTNFGLITQDELLVMLKAVLDQQFVAQLDLIKKFKEKKIDCKRFLWELIIVLKKSLEFKLTKKNFFLDQQLFNFKNLILKTKISFFSKLISLLSAVIEKINQISRPWFYLELSLMASDLWDLNKKPNNKTEFITQTGSLEKNKKIINNFSSATSKPLSVDEVWKLEEDKFRKNFSFDLTIFDNEYLQEWAYKIWFNNESEVINKVDNKLKTFFKKDQNFINLISLYKSKVVAKYKSNIIVLTQRPEEACWVYWQFSKTKTNLAFNNLFDNKVDNLIIIAFDRNKFLLIEEKFKNWQNNRSPLADLEKNQLLNLINYSIIDSDNNNFKIGKSIFNEFKINWHINN